MEKKESYVAIEQGRLYCLAMGKSHTKPLIILHGGPGLGHAYLMPYMQAIGEFAFAIFYDQRGTGQSLGPSSWETHPFEIYIHDLEQLRQAFGLETVSLLGHSWGGLLASFYALAYPHHVDKLIYLNSVPLSSRDYLEFVEHRGQIVDSHKAELTAIRESEAFARGDTKTIEKYYRFYFKNYFVKPGLEKTMTLTMSPEAAISNFHVYDLFYRYTSQHAFDLYEKLAALHKQTLIIACDKDVVPVKYMEKLHRIMPSAKFVLIEAAGHFSYMEQPEIVFKTVKDFFISL